MRLQRIAVYRATRILSWVLPVVISVFVAIAGWNYWIRVREPKPAVRHAAQLPPDVDISTEGVRYMASNGDRNQFEVRASRMIVSKDQRKHLEQVEVLIFAEKPGDADREIRGDTCNHDEQSGLVFCDGNVSVELEPGTVAYVEHLAYDSNASLISSDVETTLRREGEMTGHSGSMEYFVDLGLMRLTNHFDIQLMDGGRLQGGVAVFQEREGWVTVSQGVRLNSANGEVQGGSGRADLLPGTYRPYRIVVESEASAEAPSFFVRSSWIQADLPDGSIDHVLARGDVIAEYRSSEGRKDALAGKLFGPEVEAWLDLGRVKAVEARGAPRFVSDQNTLNAEQTIRIEPAASALATSGVSRFVGDGLNIDGRDFAMVMETGGEQRFDTSSRATLQVEGFRTSADKTSATFDSTSRRISSLEQNGNVVFEDSQGGRQGASARLTLSNQGDRIDLEGDKSFVSDSQSTLYGRKIALDRQSESFVADGAVKMMGQAAAGEKPIVVLAEHAEGMASRVDYRGNVQMYPPDGQINAESARVFPMDRTFQAHGKVHSISAGGLQVWADHLEFTEVGGNRQTAHYSGNVVAQKVEVRGSLRLQSEVLNVHLENRDIDTVEASQGVEMTRATWQGRGDRVRYNVTTGEVELTGSDSAEAEVHDGDEFLKGCVIQIAANGARSAQACSSGSVKSRINIKN